MNKGKFVIQLDESKISKNLQISEGSAFFVAENLYNQVLNGEVSAIDLAELLKFMERVISEVKSKTDINGKNSFIDLVRDKIREISDNGKDCTSKYGTKLELAETGVSYNFKGCGDAEWNDLTKQMDELKKKLKKREDFLKTIDPDKGLSILNEDTGEVTTVYAPIKTSTSSFKQTLLKD